MYLSTGLRNLRTSVRFRQRILPTSLRYSSSTSSVSNNVDQIEIPKRIPREPTDILYALSATVKRDPSVPHYKFHDDPYLLPTSNKSKHSYAMAQEAGQKAAKWIKDTHRELFQHREAEPHISDFAPSFIIGDKKEFEERDLQEFVQQAQVENAIKVYEALQAQGVNVSSELKQSLLELLSFYNHEDGLAEDYIEERKYKENVPMHERQWKNGQLADKIFEEIEPKTGAAYAAIIRGMAKYNQAQRAFALFEEATEKGIELDTNTYNAILKVATSLKETYDERWALCEDLLTRMAQQKLKPNLDTLNAVLQTVANFGNFKLARKCCVQTLSHFKKLGVQPSLGSYYFVLRAFCRERSPISHVLVNILQECAGKEFKIQHEADTRFFTGAMDVLRNQLHDKNLAQQLNDLLLTGNNYELLGNNYREATYYRHYLVLLSQTENFEQFWQVYERLVPNVYIPEPGIIEEILKLTEMNGAYQFVPRIWSDIIVFGYANRENLISYCMHVMSNALKAPQTAENVELCKQFAEIAADIYKRLTDTESRNNFTLKGETFGEILTLLLRGEAEFEKVLEVFKYINDNQHRIAGTPNEAHLKEYIDMCISNKAPSPALHCLQYAVENNLESAALVKQIQSGFTLSEEHQSRIRALVGRELGTDAVASI